MSKKFRFFYIYILVLCSMLLFHYLSLPHAGASGAIRVFVDNREIAFQIPPFIKGGRTLVPLRAIMENMNATVDWDSGRGRVSVREGERIVILDLGSNLALVNGRPVAMEIPPQIINGRTFIPLRFLSESIGYRVFWENDSKTVYIFTGSGADTGTTLQGTAPPLAVPQEKVPLQAAGEDIYGIYLGAGTGQVKVLLGEPQRVDRSNYGVDWWIYNEDLLKYLQVGIKDGRVAALYTCGLGWSFAGVSPGDTQKELTRSFKREKTVQLAYDGADFLITQTDKDLAEHPLVIKGDYAAVFYCDVHDGGRVVALLLTDTETLLKRGGMSFSYRYDPQRPPDLSLPSLSAGQKAEAATAAARQMLDLVNSARLRWGLSALSWHEEAAGVALGHSREMNAYDYFSHDSLISGKSPSDRLRDAGIAFRNAGENIAFGQPDAFSAHAGLMNSAGHRRNILNEDFTHLGVEVVEEYYTQKFLTPRTGR